MQVEPNSAHPITLQALATLPDEAEVTFGELLAWGLDDLASLEKRLTVALLDLSDVKSRLGEFKRIAEGGSPRLASEIPSEGAR